MLTVSSRCPYCDSHDTRRFDNVEIPPHQYLTITVMCDGCSRLFALKLSAITEGLTCDYDEGD